jgi:hypothetical protein
VSRHSARTDYIPDLLTGPIATTPETRTWQLKNRLVELEDQLAAWQELHMKWGHINDLIGAINDVYFLLRIDKTIPEGSWN